MATRLIAVEEATVSHAVEAANQRIQETEEQGQRVVDTSFTMTPAGAPDQFGFTNPPSYFILITVSLPQPGPGAKARSF